jgi:ABC-type transport system substrate-binding protein
MTRRPTWLSAAAIGGAIALLAVSVAPVGAQGVPAGGYSSYPVDGAVDCDAGTYNGAPYSGQLQSIEATDASTIVFTLCAPDPAFLPKIAFSAFAINDADYLIAHADDGSLVDQPNGTGPYALGEWRRGEEIILTAFPDYWGEAPVSDTVVFRWSSEPGQKLIELQSGTVDGIDNPSVDDLEALEGDAAYNVVPREGLNVFYIGMNNTHPPFNNQKIRQAFAQGIDRAQILNDFYAPGSNVAQWFAPCSIPFACTGDEWYSFDVEAAQALLAEGMAEEGIDEFPEITISLRVVDRVYLPFPEQVAVNIQDQIANNLGVTGVIDAQESGTFIDNADAGALTGLHLLGWGADYPDSTNFLDFHFGPGASDQFGQGHGDIHEALGRGATSADPAVRHPAYVDANNAIKANIPMIPVASGGSATVWQADVVGAHSSPLANEEMAVIGPGADDVLVWMQNAEPIGLFCADETDGESLRACEQIHESLYRYETAGTAAIPSLATGCTANDDLSQWTCTLREGVTFHDGSTLDVNDVVTSYAIAWDTSNPLHVGRDGNFAYFPGLWGGFLEAGGEG